MAYTVEDAVADAWQIKHYLENPLDVEQFQFSTGMQEAANLIVDELDLAWREKIGKRS